MANHKKKKSDIKKIRCISLSDSEIKIIKKITGSSSLSGSIRQLVSIVLGRE